NSVAPWVCEGQGGLNGTYLGNGQQCASCNGGANVGQNCRRCSNNNAQVCNRDSDCGAGTCTFLSNAFCGAPNLCVSNATCNTGACCNAGVCTETTPGGCGGTFQGFGTSCDHDGGYDAANQDCCPQSVLTDGDNCGD